MTPFTRVVRGVWKPEANEIMNASVTTKLCFLVGLALVVIDAKFSDLVKFLLLFENIANRECIKNNKRIIMTMLFLFNTY